MDGRSAAPRNDSEWLTAGNGFFTIGLSRSQELFG
jgi:hypothetical protein